MTLEEMKDKLIAKLYEQLNLKDSCRGFMASGKCIYKPFSPTMETTDYRECSSHECSMAKHIIYVADDYWQAAQAAQQERIAELEKKYARAIRAWCNTLECGSSTCPIYPCCVDTIEDQDKFFANDSLWNADNTLKTDEDKALEYKDLEERGK